MLSQPRSVVPFLKRGSHTSGNLTSHPGLLDSCPLTRSTQQIFPKRLLGAGHCARCWGRDERGSSCTLWVPIYVCAKSLQSYPTLCSPLDYSLPGSSVREDSPGKNTGVSCHALLKGIFPTQGSNRVAYVSCIVGFITTSITWEAHFVSDCLASLVPEGSRSLVPVVGMEV